MRIPRAKLGCLIFCSLLLLGGVDLFGQAGGVSELEKRALAAYREGKTDQAFALAREAIELEPGNPQGYHIRGRLHDATRQFGKAVADYDQILKLSPRAAQIYHLRGISHFKLARIQEAIADFDRYIELDPAQAPHHWQRGICYYYAGQYEKGRKQFELHQTVNHQDVENAVWHFLCVARQENAEKARASLISIQNDSRVPMMQVYALFAGKGTSDEVLAAAKAGEPSVDALQERMFYAHFYLGLYAEVTGNSARAQEHISKATREYAAQHFMGDVARIHAQLRGQAKGK